MPPSDITILPQRVLAISDKVEPRIYGPHLHQVVGLVDMVISCGDLPYYYLEYIVSSLDQPFLYVHGNHDRPEYRANKTVVNEPWGGVNLHGRTQVINDLIFAGLEGSHRYNNNPRYQYSQTEMWLQVFLLAPHLIVNRVVYGRSLDVLVTHSPPFGIHDATDRPHVGFQAFLHLMRWFKPKYLLHGHQHVYSSREVTRTRYMQTQVINVYPSHVINLVIH